MFYMFTIAAAESVGDPGRQALQKTFCEEVGAHYEKMNKGLKSFEPEGSERRDREEDWIVNARQFTDNIEYYVGSLSAEEIFALFQTVYSGQPEAGRSYLVFKPSDIDKVVLDSLQLPKSFACYLKIASQQQ